MFFTLICLSVFRRYLSDKPLAARIGRRNGGFCCEATKTGVELGLLGRLALLGACVGFSPERMNPCPPSLY